jgi:S-adenosylmethionine decarboxylase
MHASLSGQLGDRSLAPVGMHCILELYDCPANLLNDLEFIQQTLRTAAEKACSTLLGEVAHQFNPHGVTALALLAESHISVHTWPELGYVAADVFTCGTHTQPETACAFMITAFQAEHHCLYSLPRRPGGSSTASADSTSSVSTADLEEEPMMIGRGS